MFNKCPWLGNNSANDTFVSSSYESNINSSCSDGASIPSDEFPRRNKVRIVKSRDQRGTINNCKSSLASSSPPPPEASSSSPSAPAVESVIKFRLIWQRFKALCRGLCICGRRKRKSCNGKLAAWKTFRKDCFGNSPIRMEEHHHSGLRTNTFFSNNVFAFEREKLPHDSSPPPPYNNAQMTRDPTASFYHGDRHLFDSSKSLCSMETAGPDQALHGGGETPWCKILYWEGNERKGNVFPVLDPAINVLGDTPHGSGLSLAAFFGGPPRDERIRKTRRKICQGLVLWREGKVVWVYNRSEAPVYLNSASLDGSFFNLNLYKCPPGYAMIIYYYEMAHALMGLPDYKNKCLDKADVNSVRISFAKGWGKNYHRREILCCPCWIEVHVVPTLKVEQLTPPR